MLLIAFVGSSLAGCGEDQPNAPAASSAVTPDFAAKSADDMKGAVSGMDLKKAKAESAKK
jgi:hypothetical protein